MNMAMKLVPCTTTVTGTQPWATYSLRARSALLGVLPNATNCACICLSLVEDRVGTTKAPAPALFLISIAQSAARAKGQCEGLRDGTISSEVLVLGLTQQRV